MSKFIAPNATENIALEAALPLVRKLNLIGIVTGGIVAIATTGGGANAEVLELADFERNGITRDTPAHLFVRLDGPTSNAEGGNTMPVSGNFKQLAAIALTVKNAPNPETAAERLLDSLNVGDLGHSARERFLRISSVRAAYDAAVRKVWDAA